MEKYQAAITAHLGRYAKRRLGIFEEVTFKGRKYSHILPWRLRLLNFLEPVRAELQDYLVANPSITTKRRRHPVWKTTCPERQVKIYAAQK